MKKVIQLNLKFVPNIIMINKLYMYINLGFFSIEFFLLTYHSPAHIAYFCPLKFIKTWI